MHHACILTKKQDPGPMQEGQLGIQKGIKHLRDRSVRFLSSGFIHQSTVFGPLFTLLHFFEFCFEIAELFEFEIRTAVWPLRRNKFFADTRDLKLGDVGPRQCYLYTYTFLPSLSLKR
jgi:hypothetical protein